MASPQPTRAPRVIREFYECETRDAFTWVHSMEDFWSAVEAGKEAFITLEECALRARHLADGSYICESMVYLSEIFRSLPEAQAWVAGEESPPVLTETIA